jgi:hypothetical protein
LSGWFEVFFLGVGCFTQGNSRVISLADPHGSHDPFDNSQAVPCVKTLHFCFAGQGKLVSVQLVRFNG